MNRFAKTDLHAVRAASRQGVLDRKTFCESSLRPHPTTEARDRVVTQRRESSALRAVLYGTGHGILARIAIFAYEPESASSSTAAAVNSGKALDLCIRLKAMRNVRPEKKENPASSECHRELVHRHVQKIHQCTSPPRNLFASGPGDISILSKSCYWRRLRSDKTIIWWRSVEHVIRPGNPGDCLTTNLTPRKCLGFKTPFQAVLADLRKDVQNRFS
jgi:hypothetical protein